MSGTLIFETVGAVALLGAAFIARHYLRGYIAAKGHNLATREDIRSITKLVEETRRDYRSEMERLRASLQFSASDRLALADRRRRALLDMFNQMLLLQELLAVNLGDLPMDQGKSLFRHQYRVDSQFRRTLRAYHVLLLFLTRDEDLPSTAERYITAMLSARAIFRREFFKVKLSIVDETTAYSEADRPRYPDAVRAADKVASAFYASLDPHTTEMRKAFSTYLRYANREFAGSGADLFPGGSA